MPPSATAHELFRGFSYVAPGLLVDGISNAASTDTIVASMTSANNNGDLSSIAVSSTKILNWGSLSFKTFGDLHKCISWIVNVVRSVTSLHPSSVLRGTITILCMIVAVTGAHGVVVTYILVHKSTIRNCWTSGYYQSLELKLLLHFFWTRIDQFEVELLLTYHKGI